MIVAATIFWVCFALVVYTCVGYPILVRALARWLGRPVMRRPVPVDRLPGLSIVISAYNEERFLEERVRNIAALDYPLDRLELILVSDGSTDGTAELARRLADETVQPAIRVLELLQNVGKAAALNEGVAIARHEILVLGDARQTWASDALVRLVENFADPSVGAVGGDLDVQAALGAMAGVGVYWRFEKWLRRQESRLDSTVGLTGAISAVRRDGFPVLPQGTILDDVYWPLRVVIAGFRVVHDERASAFDRLPEHAGDEFRRKVRTLSGNLQLVTLLPQCLLPWRNRVWFQLVSHKLMRLVVPWLLLIMLGLSVILRGPIYEAALGCQLALYALGIVGLCIRKTVRVPGASAAASFLVLNCAAWLACWVWATGRTRRTWTKVHYELEAADELHGQRGSIKVS